MPFLSIIIIALNIYFLKNLFLGVIAGLFYFFFLSNNLRQKFEPRLNNTLSWVTSLSLISFIGALIYYFYQLNYPAILATLILVAFLIKIIPFKKITKKEPFNIDNIKEYFCLPKNIPSGLKKILTLIYFVFYFILVNYLFIFQTTNSIRSPWKILPPEFLIFYFLATLLLIFIICSANKKKHLFLITAHFLLSVGVAIIIYKIGFGFDQFIHQATEKVIVNKGLITPKPLYYLGQYSLVIIISKIFFINYVLVDKFLTIILFSLFLPLTIYNSFKKISPPKYLTFFSLFFLIFPFSTFIATTPQSLSNLFLLFIIFFSLPIILNRDFLLPIIFLTIATLLIHPLSGIPAIIFLGFIFIYKINSPLLKKILLLLFLIISSVFLPLLFFLNSQINNLPINLTLPQGEKIIQAISHFQIYFVNNFNFPFDFIYFYKTNFYIIIFFLTLVIILLNYKKNKFLYPYFLSFLVLFINYLLLKFTVSFDFLINYEQNNYANRILEISFYFLYPLIFYGGIFFLKKLSIQKIIIKFLFIIFIAGLITSSFYINYPRSDDYETSNSFNTSQTDIKTVQWINQDGGNKNFIVLANQQVSAAALRKYGFKKYYNSQFYYPLPTSSPLYAYYLKMIQKSSKREYIEEAMRKFKVQQAYFVMNNYWWRFREITAEAKKTADSFQLIDNGQNIVFKYNLK